MSEQAFPVPLSQQREELSAALAHIRQSTQRDYPFALIGGSGLDLASLIEEEDARLPLVGIPHLAPATVAGHRGELILGTCQGKPLALQLGRLHYYEGHSLYRVTFPVRLLSALGARVLVVTTASGGIHRDMAPGDVMLHSDFINLLGDDPLRGVEVEPGRPRFLDLSAPYDLELTDLLEEALLGAGLVVHRGTFAARPGPCYETRAEIEMLRSLGVGAVSMSTVPEVVVGNHLGMRVVGLSIITNRAGVGKLSHEEVLRVSQQASERLCQALQSFLARAEAGGEGG